MPRKKKSKKRHYKCKLPVNSRFLFCRHKKAGSHCMKSGVWGDRCPNLVISYK